jgi:hypothetical protein
MAYDINPSPLPGVGAFGLVPGTIGMPDPAADLAGQIPNLGAINAQAGTNIFSNLLGRLSPGMQAQLQNAAASKAVMGGMPGGGAYQNSLYGNLDLLGNVLSSEQLQAQGLDQYNKFIPTVSATQTVRPETQAGIAAANASKLAAPNPQAAAMYAESLFNKYMNRFGGGPAGGTGGYSIRGSAPFGEGTKAGTPPGIVVGQNPGTGTQGGRNDGSFSRDAWLASIGLTPGASFGTGGNDFDNWLLGDYGDWANAGSPAPPTQTYTSRYDVPAEASSYILQEPQGFDPNTGSMPFQPGDYEAIYGDY